MLSCPFEQARQFGDEGFMAGAIDGIEGPHIHACGPADAGIGGGPLHVRDL